jgi:hypothetical protein
MFFPLPVGNGTRHLRSRVGPRQDQSLRPDDRFDTFTSQALVSRIRIGSSGIKQLSFTDDRVGERGL